MIDLADKLAVLEYLLGDHPVVALLVNDLAEGIPEHLVTLPVTRLDAGAGLARPVSLTLTPDHVLGVFSFEGSDQIVFIPWESLEAVGVPDDPGQPTFLLSWPPSSTPRPKSASTGRPDLKVVS